MLLIIIRDIHFHNAGEGLEEINHTEFLNAVSSIQLQINYSFNKYIQNYCRKKTNINHIIIFRRLANEIESIINIGESSV